MMHRSRKLEKRFRSILFFSLCPLLQACVDPVEPEFDYQLGLPYIDALLATNPGVSYVTIYESAREFGVNLNKVITGAVVSFVNKDTGTSITLQEQDGTYVPGEAFTATAGETWELAVTLPNGQEYRSLSETIPPAVPEQSLEVTHTPALFFSDEFEANVPGHRLLVDFEDPGGTPNYYYWRYRTYERLVHCRECYGGTIFRNNECIIVNPESDLFFLKNYYTYACEERCWRIRYSDRIDIFSDTFTDGQQVTALPVADIVLFTRRDILVELQQFGISSEAYRYYKTLKDLIDNNSGFNAPLPAALIGNLYSTEDPEKVVLGRFTAASSIITPIFIERRFVEEEPLEPILLTQPEGDEVPPPVVTTAPCVESRFRTSEEPEGWQDQ